MSLSRTAIANLALSRLGEPAIANIDDDQTVKAGHVRTVFEHSVRQLGRLHQWGCLQARQQLTQNAVAPAFGYSYSYNLPEDCIRVVSLNDLDAWDLEDWYDIEQGVLLCDESEAKLVYICYTEDSTRYDPLFTEALAVLIAAKLAAIIRQDEQLGMALMQEFKQTALPDAVVADANENYFRPGKPTTTSEWLGSRRGVNIIPIKY